MKREPSHCGVCAKNLHTHGLKNSDDLTLVPIICAGDMAEIGIGLSLVAGPGFFKLDNLERAAKLFN